jgi:uncharacterized protein (TIGR03437 family)
LLFWFAVPAQAQVQLSVTGTTTSPCITGGTAALGNVIVLVNQAGVITSGTTFYITVNPAILVGTPVAGGAMAGYGTLIWVSSGALQFTFSTSASVSAGNTLTISGLTGFVSYAGVVTAAISVSDPSIVMLSNSWTIAYVSAVCGAFGHIATSVTSLTFGGPVRGTFPPQTFTVTNSTYAGQNLNPYVSPVYPLGAFYSWLFPVAATETAGVTVVSVYVDASYLPQGDYTAQVRIDSSYADNSPQYVNVSLKIGKPGRIDLSAASTIACTTAQAADCVLCMAFVAAPGKNPPSQNLTVKNGATGTLAPTASATSLGGGWLFAVAPADPLDEPAVFQVLVRSTTLQMGSYTGKVIVASDNAYNSPQIVGVTLTVKNPTPTIALSPQFMIFQADQGTSPAAQTLTINNSDTGDLAWQAQAATSSGGGNWLSVSPASGSAPSTASVSVNLADVLPGTYTGTITISSGSDAVTNSPQTISVTLTVASVTPVIGVTASSLAFAADAGTNPLAQSFTVNNTGSGSLSWTASATTASGGNWLSITPTSGSAGASVQVTVSSAALAIGVYSGTITITSSSLGISNPTVTIPVSLLVRSTTPLMAVTPASLTFSSTPGGAAPPAQTVALVNAGASVLNWTATVTTASGGNWLIVSPLSGTAPSTLTVSIDTSRVGGGKFTGSITLKASGAPDVTIPVEYSTGTPKINPNGVVNAAHLASAGLSPGGLITIFGSSLAIAAKPALPIPYLPDELGGTSVQIGAFKAKLLYVSPTQINAQVPVELTSESAQLKVLVSGLETDAVTLKVLTYDPGLFTTDGDPAGLVAALNPDLTPITVASPAKRGTMIMLYGTGWGPVSPAVTSGQFAGTTAQTVQKPDVQLSGWSIPVVYSGLAPGFVGVYMVQIQIPADAPTGSAVPIVLGIGGRGTNYAKIAIR